MWGCSFRWRASDRQGWRHLPRGGHHPPARQGGRRRFSKLKVHETEGWAVVDGQTIRAGDWIAVDGWSGSVYLGRHERSGPAEPRGGEALSPRRKACLEDNQYMFLWMCTARCRPCGSCSFRIVVVPPENLGVDHGDPEGRGGRKQLGGKAGNLGEVQGDEGRPRVVELALDDHRGIDPDEIRGNVLLHGEQEELLRIAGGGPAVDVVDRGRVQGQGVPSAPTGV